MQPWTILRVLDWTREHFESKGLTSPRLDAELLLGHALGLQRVMLYAKFDQPLGADELAKIRGLVARRARGEPIAYILGEREFYSMAFEVGPDVLIPRPDTETLVEVALRALSGRDAPQVLDVGTGSGCVALAIAKQIPTARVTAIDISDAALAIARKNAERHGLADRTAFVKSDLLAELPADAGPFDFVAANLPYIPRATIATLMRDVRDFEPRLALDGGADGLELIRRLIREAPARLAPGGKIALELDPQQKDAALGLLRGAGWRDSSSYADLAGQDRVVEATWMP